MEFFNLKWLFEVAFSRDAFDLGFWVKLRLEMYIEEVGEIVQQVGHLIVLHIADLNSISGTSHDS